MEVKNIKKITPRFNYVITTADCGTFTKNGIAIEGADGYKGEGGLQFYQKVIAKGSFVKDEDIKVGDVVKINLIQYAKKMYDEDSIKSNIKGMNPTIEYDVPTIEIDGKKYLYLRDNAIEFVVNEYE